jgi:c-di-GMP-binding flagellar brake protein YcgR
MTAHVVRTTPRSEHGAREAVAGCRFVDLTAEQASRLARFIFAQQRAASHAS